MTNYVEIVNAQKSVDSPVTEPLITALRDNPIAMLEGASGAPRAALAMFNSTIALGTDFTVESPETYISASQKLMLLQSGFLQVNFVAVRTAGGGVVNFRSLRTGVMNSITFSSSSVNATLESDELVPGDVIWLEGNEYISSIISVKYQTSGTLFIPYASPW